VLVSAVLLTLAPCARATDPPAKPEAADLVQAIIDDESKIDTVRSLYLRFEGHWTTPPDSIARRIARRKAEGNEVDPAKDCGLWPEMDEELEVAFDERRARYLRDWHHAITTLNVFDGKLAIQHSQTLTSGDEGYFLATEPEAFVSGWLGDLSWLRMAPHRFWFVKQSLSDDQQARLCAFTNDYVHAGEEEFNGRHCYVLENARAGRRIYIGVDDRRLHGLTVLYLPTEFETFPEVLPIASKLAGRTFDSVDEVKVWVLGLGLNEEAEARFREQFEELRLPLMRPMTVEFLDDYREVAPGLWFPARQGYEMYETAAGTYEGHEGTPMLNGRRELKLLEVKVNQPLAGSLFTIELKDGVPVGDQRYDPPLNYLQKADRTPEEWQKLIAEQAKEDEESEEEADSDAAAGDRQPSPN
jgi:hypothetical protein